MNWSVRDTHLLCSIYSHVWECQSVTESCVHMCPPSLSTRNWDTPELTYTHPLTTRHCCTPVHSPYTSCTLASEQWVSVLVLHSLRLNWCREQVNSLYLQLLSHSLLSSGARTSLYGHCTLHVHQPHQFPLRPTIYLFVFPFKRMEAIWRIYMDEHNTSRVCKYLLRKLYILHIICTAYGGKI